MNRIDQLREQIDACRAGSDDLHLPELAGLAQAVEQDRAVVAELDRSLQFDRQVISAVHDVAVPAGLVERLLERLLDKTAATDTTASPAAATTDATTDATPVLAAAVERAVGEAVVQTKDRSPSVARAIALPTRRLWFWRAGSLAVAAAAVAVLAVVWSRQTPRTITQEQLAAEVPAWVDEVNSRPQWFGPTQAPAGFPVGRAVLTQAVGWQNYRLPAGERAVVYNVTPTGGAKVLLFVVATADHYLVDTAPDQAMPGTTGGTKIVAWQREGGPLYVLYVSPGGFPIDQYIRKQRVT